MNPSLSQRLSLAEFLQLPEVKPAYEFIDGYIFAKPMPQGKHSILQTRLTSAINLQGIPQKQVCAFTELRCTFSGRSLVADIAVFHWERIPLNAAGEVENVFSFSPDWLIEILSPDQATLRVINHLLFALNHGAELGWLIDPADKTVLTFRPQQQPILLTDPADVLPVLSRLEPWFLTIGELFSWLSL